MDRIPIGSRIFFQRDAAAQLAVARMERSVIRILIGEAAPEFASLHPGYGGLQTRLTENEAIEIMRADERR
jgi:hypothetical protein